MPSSNPLTPSDVLKGKSPTSPAQPKGVEIVEEPDEIIPPPVYDDERPDTSPVKKHRASIVGKKMTGRPAIATENSSSSLSNKISNLNLGSSDHLDVPAGDKSQADAERILSQVAEWLKQEKSKRSRKGRKRHEDKEIAPDEDDVEEDEGVFDELARQESGPDLGSLEGILAGYMKSSSAGKSPRLLPRTSSFIARKGSKIAQKFKRNSVVNLSSDTEFFGDEVLVPNVEANLDNSKTLAFTGGDAETDGDSDVNTKAKKKDEMCWDTFKKDILRLTHTLRLKGWRRIPMEKGGELEVARLSGALTNAVYVVKPPKKLKGDSTDTLSTEAPKRKPMPLLLRIYGPQVEHLIDRDVELNILKRLARKKIGPRMLGTFSNGRFEEYLNATTLEAKDLRVPETSKQIAKRMRELHEGIELLESEIECGPSVFANWDKWVDRCETVMTFLDKQVHQAKSGEGPKSKRKYTRLGLICGTEWPVFRRVYDTYRAQLVKENGGESGIREKLVFAHSDTQYGNLMRLLPAGESPLLQPSNHHKQLVVIDFEYAGPNCVGYEFADHFSEWCYDYHADDPHACHHKDYPTLEEQRRLVRSYVMHRPQFNPAASATPKMDGREKTNISDFMLDARAPPGSAGSNYDAEEVAREKKMEAEIAKLIHETRLWRIACAANWVAWGIVQAEIPELDEPPKKSIKSAVVDKVKSKLHPHSDPLDELEKAQQADAKHDRPEGRAQEEGHNGGDDDVDPDEFDYLAYSQERAMMFWGDCLQIGLIKEEEIPDGMKKMLKVIPY